MLEAEIRSLQRRLVRRDNEILKQERELHKLRVSEVMSLYQSVSEWTQYSWTISVEWKAWLDNLEAKNTAENKYQ